MALTRLCVADHPAAVWAEAVEPWLRARGAQWRERRAVLAPNAGWAAALKAQAVERGLPVIGVKWLTPGKFRALALGALPGPARRVALREDLHLLIELAAAGLPDNAVARASGADPAGFQELLDMLDGAGWDGEALANAEARALAAEAVKLRERAGWVSAVAADRALRDAAPGAARLGGHLLAVGFGPGDWALRALLEAAVEFYEKTELVLEVVDFARTSATTWVGTWEESAGHAEWLEPPAGESGRFAGLAERIADEDAQPTGAAAGPRPRIFLTEELQAEADVVAGQTLEFLSETEASTPARVGVVVGPVNSPLAREVAARFAALGLPHHDAPGHQPGRTPAQAMFETWLDWQESGRLAGVVGWTRAARRYGRLTEHAGATVEKGLNMAADATLSDDPAVLSAWLRGRPELTEAGEFLTEWPRLPEAACWDDLMAAVQKVAEKLGWPESPETLAERAAGWTGALTERVPRAAVLRWVRAVTRVPGRTRDGRGREPFAPLQIVDAASAVAQPWTHLVLGGLQHGEWPADEDDSPLLDAARMAALNREVLRQGSQGEGHAVVARGRGLLLTAGERRRLARAAFTRLVALPTAGLALTARREDPADGRVARWSEYFWTAAAHTLGRLPEDRDWDDLSRKSAAWREAVRRRWAGEAESVSARVDAPARAYAARRDGTRPFDEFSFCLKERPAAPLRLSCKGWEEAAARPGEAWHKHLLRVEPPWEPATEDATGRMVGTWAHAWVRPGPGGQSREEPRWSAPLPERGLWQKMAEERARSELEAVTKAFASAGRELSEAWLDAWANAARAARDWIDALAGLGEWPEGLAEINLISGLKGNLPHAGLAIPLVGRMDLVLLSRAGSFAPGGLAGAAAWLVDFKTGGDEPLRLNPLAKGKGLQLALYALALRALGAGPVALTLLTRDGAAEPQLAGEDLENPELAGLWKLVAEMAVTGCWGDRMDLAGEHGRPVTRPLATLPIPGEILRKKWALTRPDAR